MAKKWCVTATILVVALTVLGGCVSTPVAKQAYPAETELYPAVYGTFKELYPKAKYLKIDFYNKQYTLTGITGYALTTPVSYNMTVKLSQSGEIDISYSDIYMYDPSANYWSKAESFGFYDYNKAAGAVAARIAAIANDPATLDRYTKEAMADIKFVYTIMKDFTGLAFQDFIDKYAKGSVFNINGPVSDVKESGKEINGTTYKYLVTLTESLADEGTDSYIALMLNEYVYCRLYTNQEDVIRLNKESVLAVKGTLVEATQGLVGARFYLDMVDVENP